MHTDIVYQRSTTCLEIDEPQLSVEKLSPTHKAVDAAERAARRHTLPVPILQPPVF